MRLKARVPVLFALVVLAGCATSPFQVVPMPDPDVPLDDPGMMRVFVMRGGDLFSENKDLFVADGETIIGAIGRGDYLCWDRPATITQIKYYLNSGARPTGEVEGNHRLIPQPGKTVYLEVSFPLGEDRMKTDILLPEYGRYLIEDKTPAPHRAALPR